MHNLDSIPLNHPSTQTNDISMTPTQDLGLAEYSPLTQRFIYMPVSTSDSTDVEATQHDNNSPPRRKGRLVRKADMTQATQSDATSFNNESSGRKVVNDYAEEADDLEEKDEVSAFAEMQRASRRQKQKLAKLHRAQQRALGMVDEQAEESEDEYAGLGGADGEDSDDDSDAGSVRDMIDDAAGDDVDKIKLASFFA